MCRQSLKSPEITVVHQHRTVQYLNARLFSLFQSQSSK
jgi:hypothetical protein